MELSPYLIFDGDCETAFKRYEKVFDGKIVILMRNADMPPGTPFPPGAEKRIMHVRLKIGDRTLMGSDALPGNFKKQQGFSVSLQTGSPTEADRMFSELSEGGTVTMPIAETFWAKRFGMLTDKFGIHWIVNCDKDQAA